MLIASDIPVTLIDTDIEMIDVAGEFGAKVYFGDGTRLDLLRQAGAGEAELILFCIDGDQIERRAARGGARGVPAGGDLRPRLRPPRGGQAARRAGRGCGARGDGIGGEDGAASRSTALGVSAEEIDRAEDMYRARDKERLKIQIETGDIRAARDRIITQPGPREP